MRRPRELSKKAATLVAAFDKAARDYGYLQDQGSQAESDEAQIAHQKAFDNLRRYITRLEYFREEVLRKGIGK